ncbi:MAG: methyltransferase domain-containing protein [Bdellovibrionaceae bacterium]|nr:methyltransferase domain-containing protein [Pseudobdellovibrionaceae bacterium]
MNTYDQDRFAAVDENGWIIFDNRQIEDSQIASEFYKNLQFLPNRSFGSTIANQAVIVEAFDCPLIVHSFQVDTVARKITLTFNYSYVWELEFKDFVQTVMSRFYLDVWDRVYGLLSNGIPFSFSKKAHGELLDSLDEFDDESFVFDGQRVVLDTLWHDESQLEGSAWWDQAYTGERQTVTNEEYQKLTGQFAINPGWNLEAPAETLKDMLPRMKLPKSRVLILGCGDSHDAAFFAESGHKVTAVDISAHAIERSKKLFGHLPNITWLQSDLFKLPANFQGSFDLVYEYTCLCALNPELRSQLIQVWSRCLHDQGQLMATLFCMHKRDGPPFGGSEWEFRELLKKRFQPLIWNRWRKSVSRRQGRELFVLAQKRKL